MSVARPHPHRRSHRRDRLFLALLAALHAPQSSCFTGTTPVRFPNFRGKVASQVQGSSSWRTVCRMSDDDMPSDVDPTTEEFDAQPTSPTPAVATTASYDASELKVELLRLAAAANRGFGASQRDRDEISRVVDKLSAVSPTDEPTRSLAGVSDGTSTVFSPGSCPMEGCWKLIYTTALDVVVLDASPLTSLGAIYQDIKPPFITNVIDQVPKLQALLPVGQFSTRVRQKVLTRASVRGSSRVGLTFESVSIAPLEIFGVDASSVPTLNFDLPRLPESLTGSIDSSPAFFDVVYLDENLLIIKQNEPGGIFASVRVYEDL